MEPVKGTKAEADFLEEIAGQGFEGMGPGDYAVPFLKIITNGCPECTKGKDGYIDGLEPGVFMNTLTKHIYGPEINLIALKYEPVWLAWAPNRGGLRGRYDPGSIEVTGNPYDGMKDKDGNTVSDTMVFYCLIEGHLEDGPIVFSLSASGLRHAKNWNSMILLRKTKSGKRAAYFSAVWNLRLELNSNDQGVWYQIGNKKTTNVKWVRDITLEELKEVIQPTRQLLIEGSSRVDYAQIEGHSPEQIAATAKAEDF
jgi:hypothetical protein